MAKLFTGYLWIASLATVIAAASQSTVFAQSKNWNAENLASPFPAPQTEAELIEALKSGDPATKAIACKQLSIYGTKACVPEVAKLLSDEKLSSWARIALEAIPEPECDAALVEAAGTLKGKLLVGVINSIGERRSPGSIEVLAERLNGSDEQAASAAAIALGKIGSDETIHVGREAFAKVNPVVRGALAEGGILAAERLLADGKNEAAAQIYDSIRKADVPQQRILEATRGAIIARGDDGIPMLVEQLNSDDADEFRMALSTARELAGNRIVDELSEQVAAAQPQRASLILYAIGDRENAKLPASVLQAASKGDPQVRRAAIELLGRLGDASAAATLLEIAAASDATLSQAAKSALANLPGKEVDSALASRLPAAKGKTQAILIELAGQRRIATATPELVKALKHQDEATRNAALASLGETVGAKDLNVLITEVVKAKDDAARARAEKSLHTAAIRMPDREATAAELSEAIEDAPIAAKVCVLRILGAMGGPKALETIAAASKDGDDQLKDVTTRVLGEWMTADAGPVLLEITKDPDNDRKYQVRALRGYLRIARQLKQLPNEQRIAMAREALEIAQRAEERELALDVLRRCPSPEAIELATALIDDGQVRDKAVETALFIGEQIKSSEPAAAKSAGLRVLEAHPNRELTERAKALASP